jgi:hypothetical protein
MTFHYDAAAALARIRAGLSQHAEDPKPEGFPANPANIGPDAQSGLADLASLAGVPSDSANVGIATTNGLAELASLAGIHPDSATTREDQKSGRPPANLANPANIGSDIPKRLAGLAGLAGVPAEFHADDHAAEATSSSASSSVLAAIEDQKPEGLPANLAKPANIGSSTGEGVAGASAPSASPRAIRLRSQPQPQGEWSPEDWLVFYGERVGIGEHDFGLPRPEAESRAYDTCIAEWLYRTALVSEPGPCPICGDADRPNDMLLAVGIVGGRTWLHIGCVKAWCAGRQAEAVAALAAMGIKGPEGSST